MKKVFLLFSFIITASLSINAQPGCKQVLSFSQPGLLTYPWAMNWQYIDYVIPAGFKVDSVFADFSRSGATASQQDYALSYCPTTSYIQGTETNAWDYQSVDTAMYNIWYDLTSLNFTSTGMIRFWLVPTANGGIWNSAYVAISSTNSNLNVNIIGLPQTCEAYSGLVTLNGLPIGGIFSGNGVSNNTFDPLQGGLGQTTIFYTYTSPEGCSKTVSDTITVLLNTSLPNTDDLLVNLYPQPCNGIFNITLPYALEVKLIQIYSIEGRLIDSNAQSNNSTYSFDISKEPNGLYIARIQSTNKVYIKKVSKG